MHVIDYIEAVDRVDRNRALMARIILNTLVDPNLHPVDVSELRMLSPHHRALTNAFEEWAFSHGDFEFDSMTLIALREWAKGAGNIKACGA